MSAHNGDKSRYHRLRKRNIARRLLNKELFKSAGAAAAVKTPPKKAS